METTPIDAYEREHARLLAAIGDALGYDSPFEEVLGTRDEAIHLGTLSMPPSGAGRRVLGGVVCESSGRVAWVEENCGEAHEGYVPVSIDLCIAAPGRRLLTTLPLETYNPYFGCQVRLARWYGESLVWIYREKHRTLLARVDPPYDTQQLVALDDELIQDGDDVYTPSSVTGLVTGRRLRDLTALSPLPVRASGNVVELLPRDDHAFGHAIWPYSLGEDHEAAVRTARDRAERIALPPPEVRALPRDPRPLRDALLDRVRPCAPSDLAAALLIDTVAAPFFTPESPIATHYEATWAGKRPDYLVAHHVRAMLRSRAPGARDEARAWVDWLKGLARGAPLRWGFAHDEPSALAAWTATAFVHVRARVAVLAQAIEKGTLPYAEGCAYFEPLARRAPLDAYPAHVVAAIEALDLAAPRPDTLRW